MLFNSLTFIVFFIIVFTLHNLPFSWKIKKINLVIASYIFYAAWNPPFVLLLWLVTLIDWFVARWIYIAQEKSKRRLILLISLTTNLGILSYFKYGDFILRNFVMALHQLGVEYNPPVSNIVLPVGISFYTFVTISYTIDVYRHQIAPAKSFVDYCLLVTFFPHLVAGPILRASQFLPQCLEPQKANFQQIGWGLALMIFGLFEKIVLADGLLAPVANTAFWMKENIGCLQAWLGLFAFTSQLFLDFNGYSLCAIGAALCLGFVFPDNFRFPFASIGFSDLWQRWHISLSSWLRDYLYIPLGGNRKGKLRTSFNIFITMLIGGLWHGAAWQYIIWGGIHGVYLIIEHALVRLFSGIAFFKTKIAAIGLMLLTFLLFNLSFVAFRAFGSDNAVKMYKIMFTGKPAAQELFTTPQIAGVIIITFWLLISHWILRNSSLAEAVSRVPWWFRSLVLACIILAIILIPGESHAFIYFQF